MQNPRPSFSSPFPLQSLFSSLLFHSFGIDLRTLALFRVALAVVLLFDLALRAGNLTAFYSDQGVLPREAYLQLYSRFPLWLNLHLVSGQPGVIAALFALSFLAACALLLGYRTRLATFVSWLLLLSLHNRNPMVLLGGDSILRLLLFWSLFLPLGARASLDALRLDNRWRLDKGKNGEENDQEEKQGTATAAPPFLSVATVAILLQIGLVYWCSAALKTDAAWTSEGSAIYYALSTDQLVTPLGRQLLAYPDLMRQLTFFTLALERFGPTLALLPFWRVRLGMVAVFLGFHLSLALCLTLGLFSYISMVGWLLFIPAQAWEVLSQRYHKSSGSGALPTEKWKGFTSLAHTFHRKVAAMWGAWSQPEVKEREVVVNSKHWGVQTVAGLSLLYILGWNLRTLDSEKYSRVFPPSWNAVGQLTRIDQRWGMFAPYPRKDDGWLLVPAKLSDGREVDLLTGGQPLTWNKPETISATFEDALWQKYLMNLWSRTNARHRGYYMGYLTRQWNQSHRFSEQIESLQLVYMREDTLPNETAPPRKVVLWTSRK